MVVVHMFLHVTNADPGYVGFASRQLCAATNTGAPPEPIRTYGAGALRPRRLSGSRLLMARPCI